MSCMASEQMLNTSLKGEDNYDFKKQVKSDKMLEYHCSLWHPFELQSGWRFQTVDGNLKI